MLRDVWQALAQGHDLGVRRDVGRRQHAVVVDRDDPSPIAIAQPIGVWPAAIAVATFSIASRISASSVHASSPPLILQLRSHTPIAEDVVHRVEILSASSSGITSGGLTRITLPASGPSRWMARPGASPR